QCYLNSIPTRRSSDLEKDDFAPNFLLDTAGGQNLSEQKSLRKKSARLSTETDNWVLHPLGTSFMPQREIARRGRLSSAGPGPGLDRKSTRLNSSHLVI